MKYTKESLIRSRDSHDRKLQQTFELFYAFEEDFLSKLDNDMKQDYRELLNKREQVSSLSERVFNLDLKISQCK